MIDEGQLNEAQQRLITGAEEQITRFQEACARAKTSVKKIMKTGPAREQSSQNEVVSRPFPMNFELAYQVPVAIDCIRFSIRSTERSAEQPGGLLQVNLQLLDALRQIAIRGAQFTTDFGFAPQKATREQGMKGVNESSIQNGVRDAES